MVAGRRDGAGVLFRIVSRWARSAADRVGSVVAHQPTVPRTRSGRGSQLHSIGATRAYRGLTATLAVVALASLALSASAVGSVAGVGKPAPPPTGVTFPPLTSCPIFPASNIWNRSVTGLPIAANSATMIAAMGSGWACIPTSAP